MSYNDKNMLHITDDLMRIADRRDFLSMHVPQCHNCFRNQVQLINQVVPALWACRVCRHQFSYEPASKA